MPRVDPNSIPTDWLIEKLGSTTFEAVLRHDLERARLIGVDTEQVIREAIPRGQKKWDEFTSEMIDSDELWFFSNSEREWASFAGRSGYAIVRNGRIVAAEITAMS